MGGKRVTTEIFIIDSNVKHNNKYDYSKSIYTTRKKKITIGCSEHGYFEMRADAHRTDGQGCPLCRRTKTSKTKQDKTAKTIIQVFKSIHGESYLYDNFIYQSDKIESIITCRTHGDFLQTPNAHKAGKGCIQCAQQDQLYRRSNYIDKCNKKYNGKSNLYLIRMIEDNGYEFFKIGITVQELRGRFANSKMPYSYDVLALVNDDAELIFNTELEIKSLMSEHRYSPLIKFGGSKYECFSHIPNKVYEMIDSLVSCNNERTDI